MDKILVVDDSLLNLTVLTRILESDYQVSTAQDGETALRMAAAAPPALILLDVIMRGASGFDVLTKLKDDPRTRDIPVIIITGLDGAQNEERALQNGAVDYITKPFTACVVRARVNTHVELYRYRRNAEHLAMYDGLTEIPNRRNFDRHLAELWSASRRDDSLFSLGLSDIDFFKGYNDRYGHPAGDDVIRAVALTLHQSLLSLGGFAARYGGEEYAFLLPRFADDNAKKIAESLRQNVESLAIPYPASEVSNCVTISLGGITVRPSYTGTPDEVTEAADRMLYLAKTNGRNQVQWSIL